MGILDDTAIFTAVIKQNGFSRAAKQLGLSNGLISRRISHLEAHLGVTLIKRTTRQLRLTPEGELFWQHANRIQQELDQAIDIIQSSATKPRGSIRLSAPPYFGRQYLTPILIKFLNIFTDIQIELVLNTQQLDPIKDQLDLVIRGAGYLDEESLKDSNMQMKFLVKEKIGLYANPLYLEKHGQPQVPEDLRNHTTIHYFDHKHLPEQQQWHFAQKTKHGSVILSPKFNCNDIESSLIACIDGFGIGRFTELNVKKAQEKTLLTPVLKQYSWGYYHLFAVYAFQHNLPQRTRLLLDFIHAETEGLLSASKKGEKYTSLPA